jgi:Tol biopolymer transport system component
LEGTGVISTSEAIQDDEMRLSWSPDGTQIVYEKQESPTDWGIYVINSSGTNVKRLTSGRRPAWSPNRPEIIFDENGKLWLINPDGSDKHAVEMSVEEIQWASWSPDGEQLVFGGNQGLADSKFGEIYTAKRDGTQLQRLTNNQVWDGRPAWRPK